MRTPDDDAPKPAAPAPAPAPRPTPAPEAEPLDEKAAKERTDAEIAERLSSPPETPTPTQAEADAAKSGTLGEQRDVKPAASGAGYTTR